MYIRNTGRIFCSFRILLKVPLIRKIHFWVSFPTLPIIWDGGRPVLQSQSITVWWVVNVFKKALVHWNCQLHWEFNNKKNTTGIFFCKILHTSQKSVHISAYGTTYMPILIYLWYTNIGWYYLISSTVQWLLLFLSPHLLAVFNFTRRL